MSDADHRSSGLNEPQWQQLKALTASLNPAQTTWISGFFAGLDYEGCNEGDCGACTVVVARPQGLPFPICQPPHPAPGR